MLQRVQLQHCVSHAAAAQGRMKQQRATGGSFPTDGNRYIKHQFAQITFFYHQCVEKCYFSLSYWLHKVQVRPEKLFIYCLLFI